MYRPQSQLSVHRKSSDIRDMHSKTKKLTNKQYKQYVKKMIENTPNHIDTDRKYIAQGSKNELKQRLQKKPVDDQRQMWRSGVMRFIKPKLSQRDYKRFKKLFDIFTKIQKSKQQIMTLTFSNNRYIKDNNSLYQNQKVKQLKENLLRLQLDQEKMLLEVENQGKENKKEGFSLEKVANAYRRHSEFEKRGRNKQSKGVVCLTEKGGNNADEQSSRSHQYIHSSSQCNISLPKQQQTHNHLSQLYQLICSMDSKFLKRSPTVNKRGKQYQQQLQQHKSTTKMYQQIRYFIVTKQKIIDQLFTSLTNANNINHKDQLPLLLKEQQLSLKSVVEQKVKQSQFCKFSQIDKRQRNIIQGGNNSSNNNNNTNNNNNSNNINSNKRYTSFKSLFDQIQHELTQYKQISVVKERSNQLARKLLTTSKQLKLCQQEKIQTEKKLTKRIHELQDQNTQLNKQIEQFQSTNQQLRNEIESAQQTIRQLSIRIEQFQQLQKQHSNFQKYYRQTLTLQQQINILSEQNQKLVKEIQMYQQKQRQQKEYYLKSKQQKQQKQQRQQKKSQERKQQQQQQIRLMRESNNSAAKLLITNKTIKQKHSQSDNTAEQKKQTQSTHEKTIKPCSNTSLIYKQFQKKNKKLSQENKKLSQQIIRLQKQMTKSSQQNKKTTQQILRVLQQNKSLTQQMMQVTQQSNTINQLNSLLQQKIHYNQARNNQLIQKHLQSTKQQLSRARQQIKFLQKENKVLLEQNKKIEQEFQYLVKQKLEIESHMNELERERGEMVMQGDRLRVGLGERMVEVYQMVSELREEKDVLEKCCAELQKVMKEGLMCVGEEVAGALEVFVSGVVNCECFISQLNQQQKQQQQQEHHQQSHQHNTTQQSSQQPYDTQFMQQYQALAIEFNHCLYELNQYKSMLNQSQIQKQLQKKYYQEDINLMKAQLSKVESQYHDNNNIKNSIKNSIKKEKLKINCELLSIHIIKEQTLIKQLCDGNMQTQYDDRQMQQNDNYNLSLSLRPQTVSCYYQPQYDQKSNIQHTEDMITLQQWLNELQTHPELEQTEEFTQFCITHLQRIPQFDRHNEQQQQHQHAMTKTYPSQKQFTKIEVIEEQSQEKIGIFGSLYNKFSFPKLQPTETKYELNKKTSVRESSYNNYQSVDVLKKDELQQQMPMQMQRNCIESALSNKNATNNVIISKNQQLPVNTIQKQVHSNNQSSSQQVEEDQEESFDLCII